MLSIIIVQHNSQILTIQAIESLRANLRNDYEVIVVDNCSKDDDPKVLKEKFPEINLIVNDKNYGFGKANNLGVKEAKGDLILFLNNDTLIKSDFTSLIKDTFLHNQLIGVIGPKLLNKDLSLQLSHSKLPSFFNEFVTKIVSKMFYKNIKPVVSLVSKKYKERKYVAFVTGASLFIRKNLFVKIGGFDERMFMYFEDADLCKRVLDSGYKVLFIPEIEILHLRGASWNNNTLSILKKHYRKSQLVYYSKHRTSLENYLLKYYLQIFGKYPNN